MNRTLVATALASFAFACGNVEPDSAPDASIAVLDGGDAVVLPPDASVDAGAEAAVEARPSYPGCRSSTGLFYECESTHACVTDCAECSGAPNHCLLASVVRGQSALRCVDSCASACVVGSFARATTCGDICSDLATDRANCGTCGHACQIGHACQQGSCAP